VLHLTVAADADVAIKEDAEERRSVAAGEDVVLRHFTPGPLGPRSAPKSWWQKPEVTHL
jgi:hypothetical protein